MDDPFASLVVFLSRCSPGRSPDEDVESRWDNVPLRDDISGSIHPPLDMKLSIGGTLESVIVS